MQHEQLRNGTHQPLATSASKKKLNVGEELSVEGSFPLVFYFMIQKSRCHILRCG